MKPSTSSAAVLLLSLVGPAISATYPLSDTVIGSAFYSAFNFEAIADPTHGRV